MEQVLSVPFAAWRHQQAREGFEVVFRRRGEHGDRFEGHTAAVEDGQAWSVTYEISLDADWRTRAATVSASSETGVRKVMLEADGRGSWLVDGVLAPGLDGCLDIDLEASVLTNAFPAHRLSLSVGQASDAPATYVRVPDVAVERLEQTYLRVSDDLGHQRYDYTAPAFDVECRLAYDMHGLLLDYPGLATRIA